mgnify:CR=1 FL=1
MNAAMLRETKANFLVTKESGAAGGFADKVQAAGDVKATCVVIIRPMQESGYSLEEVETMICRNITKNRKNRISGKEYSAYPWNREGRSE